MSEENTENSFFAIFSSAIWSLVVSPMVLVGATAAMYALVNIFLQEPALIGKTATMPHPVAIFSVFINFFSVLISMVVSRQLSKVGKNGICFGTLIWCILLIILGGYTAAGEYKVGVLSDVFWGYASVPLAGLLAIAVRIYKKKTKLYIDEEEYEEETI